MLPERPSQPARDRLLSLRGSGDEAFSTYMSGIDALAAHIPAHEKFARENLFVVDEDFLKRAAQYRLIAPSAPKEIGGLGLSLTEISHGTTELAWLSPAVALEISAVGFSLTGIPLEKGAEIAPPPRKQELHDVLRSLVTGEQRAFFALTEPKHGSDVAKYLEFEATPSQDGEYLILNGVKSFITNPEGARWGLVTARLNGEAVVLLVDMHEPQQNGKFEVLGKHDKIGQFGPVLTSIGAKDFRVPRNAVLGTWKEVARPTLIVGRTIIASQALGGMMRAMDTAYQWANYRVQFEKPLIEIPGIANMLRMGYEQLLVSQALVHRSAQAYDMGDPHATAYASVAKFIVADAAVSLGLFAQQLLGARGYVRGFIPKEGVFINPFEKELEETEQNIAQLLLDMLAFPIYEGPRSLQSDVLIYPYFHDRMDKIASMLSTPDLVHGRYQTAPLPTVEERVRFAWSFTPSETRAPQQTEEQKAAPFHRLNSFLTEYFTAAGVTQK